MKTLKVEGVYPMAFETLADVVENLPQFINRTDFIRTAIRNQLERHSDVVKQSTARKSLELGLRNYTREDLEAARRAGEMLHINVLGLASIAQDVTADLARAAIASVSVLGALHASPAVKAALADRTR
jgi:Ribbon-Helix-Helix transcriptional regulator family